jgi:putative transposase
MEDRKLIMPDLKAIYRAETADTAAAELEAFEAQWGKRYPAIGQAWRRAWEYVAPLFAFPPAIRKMIYTTNAVETTASQSAQDHQDPRQLSADEVALKRLFLAIRNAGLRWRRAIEWTTAMGQFAILFGDRFEPSPR